MSNIVPIRRGKRSIPDVVKEVVEEHPDAVGVVVVVFTPDGDMQVLYHADPQELALAGASLLKMATDGD